MAESVPASRIVPPLRGERSRVITLGCPAVLASWLNLPPRVAVISARTVHDVESLLNEASSALVVVDPSGLRDDSFSALVSTVADSGIPMLLYCELGPVTAARALRAARIMPVEIVFHGAVRESQLLSAIVPAKGEQTVSALILNGMAHNIAELREGVRVGVVAAFGGLKIARRVDEFVRPFRVDATTVRKWLRSAGLAAPGEILDCARVARTFGYIGQGGWRADLIAEDVDWTVRTMRSRYRDLIEVSPAKAARTMKASDVAIRLLRRLLTRLPL